MEDFDKIREDVVARVTRIFEEDMAAGRKAVHREDIPISYEHMTPEWLTEVLYADRPGVVVTGFSLAENDDGTSNRRRIFLEYNEEGTSADNRIACFLSRLATAADDLESLDSFTPTVANSSSKAGPSSDLGVENQRHAPWAS